MNTARRFLAGAGIQTAALGFGGNPSTATESWNGTSWTTVNSMNTSRLVEEEQVLKQQQLHLQV
jgi:hypothetical protein